MTEARQRALIEAINAEVKAIEARLREVMDARAVKFPIPELRQLRSVEGARVLITAAIGPDVVRCKVCER